MKFEIANDKTRNHEIPKSRNPESFKERINIS